MNTGKCKVEDVKAEDLPEDYRKLTVAERKARVEAASKAREEIKKKVLGLNAAREKFLAADGYIDATVAVGAVSGIMQTARQPFMLPRVPVFGYESLWQFESRLPW